LLVEFVRGVRIIGRFLRRNADAAGGQSRRSALAGSLALAAGLLLARGAQAHERDFTLSRDWHLPYRGEMEVESRSFFDVRDHDFTEQLEFEYGVTEHFAIEPGLEFKKRPGDRFETEAFEVELRFNAFEFAFDRFLPALNVEWEHPLEDEEPAGGEEEEEGDRLELKAIVSYYWKSGADFSVNLNYGRALEKGVEDESELTAGYTRPIDWVPASWRANLASFKAGAELVQELKGEHHLGAGPLLSYRFNAHFHFLATYVVALNHRDDENHDELRFIVEWEF
jgi:hypothetical protein